MNDLKNVFLTTLIPEFPGIYSYNNQVFKRKLDVIYDEARGVIIVPVNTPGRVKAATGEFVTCITDTLIVKKQWTNLYENTTTIDQDYYNTYIGVDASTRDASTWENGSYKYVDVQKSYYKIGNSINYAFACNQLGQEISLIFDPSTTSNTYDILVDPVAGTYFSLPWANRKLGFAKLIVVAYDPSVGTTWKVKESRDGSLV